MGIREHQRNVLNSKKKKTGKEQIILKCRRSLLLQGKHCQTNLCLSTAASLAFSINQSKVCLSPSPAPYIICCTGLFLFLSFSCTVWMRAAESCQAPLAYCSSTGGRLSARRESVFWRQRQETPSWNHSRQLKSSRQERRGHFTSYFFFCMYSGNFTTAGICEN